MAIPERVEFPGHDGSLLAARLDTPPQAPRAWALFAHCFSCSKDLKAARLIAAALTEAGIGVMRFDFTGLGRSEGDFANTNFSTNIQDIHAAARWLDAEYGGPQLLVGHSLGGAAMIVAAGALDQVKAVATIGAPAHADHVLKQISRDALKEIEATGEAEVTLAGRDFRIRRQFVEDVKGASVTDAARDLDRPLLILHAPLDEIVGLDNATQLFTAARHPKSFISLDQADHLLSAPSDARRAGQLIGAWAEPYVFPSGVARPAREDRHPRPVIVSETGQGKYENAVMTGDHYSLADEPESVGGGGRGPDPYEYVAAGLGACTSMTLRMYAERKAWPLRHVAVEVEHGRDHVADSEDPDKKVQVDVFTRRIFLEGPLDEAQKSRLLEIADRCPVHLTLESRATIRTQLA